MSRSAVVGLIAGAVLVVGLIVAGVIYGDVLVTRSHAEQGIAVGLGVYGAGLAAVSIRRLVDPRLSVPVLAWIVLVVFYIIRAFDREKRRQREGRLFLDDDHKSFGPDGDHMGRGWAILMTLVALALYASGIAVARYFAAQPPPTITAPARLAVPAEAPSPAAPAAPTDIVEVASLPAAIAFALPHMTDDRSAPNAAAKLLARYGAAKLTWADVTISKNETSLELVEKDPPKAWGKRLCANGTLARIEKQTVDGTELHSARLVTKSGDAIELFAVGSTGNLVKRKPARFCGVVTGRLDVAGKPATFAVGMFAP